MKILVTSLLACLILTLSGCSKNASDTPISGHLEPDNTQMPQSAALAGPTAPMETAAEAPAPEVPQDDTWYIASAKANACFKLSETFDDVETPEQLILFAFREMKASLVQQKKADDFVMLKDSSNPDSTLVLAKSKVSCEKILKLVGN